MNKYEEMAKSVFAAFNQMIELMKLYAEDGFNESAEMYGNLAFHLGLIIANSHAQDEVEDFDNKIGEIYRITGMKL